MEKIKEKAVEILTTGKSENLEFGYYIFSHDYGTLFAWDNKTKEYLRFSRVKLPDFLRSYKLVGTEEVVE
jgi:hypothetical protein